MSEGRSLVSNDTPILDAAHAYEARGWFPIQLHWVVEYGDTPEDAKCSCGDTSCKSQGKHPVSGGWQKGRRIDLDSAWDRRPNANVGLATGPRSGFFALDVDPKHNGFASLAALVEEHGPLPTTYTVRTGSGGLHYYFLWVEAASKLKNWAGKLGPGLDFRVNGGQVVAPPSVTEYGVSYTVEVHADVAEAPAWLFHISEKPTSPKSAAVDTVDTPDEEPEVNYEAVQTYIQRAVDLEVEALAGMGADSGRNARLNEAAFKLGTIGAHSALDVDDVRLALFTACELNGLMQDDGQAKCEATFMSGWRSGLKKPRTPWPPVLTGSTEPTGEFFIPFTENRKKWPMRDWDDIGNAERLVDHFGQRFVWIEQMDNWAVYDGTRWKLDDRRTVQSFAHDVLKRLPNTEALSYSDIKPTDPETGEPKVNRRTGKPELSQRELFLEFVRKQRFAAKVSAMLNSAKGIPELHRSRDEFDIDPMVLNCMNGVVDLVTGQLAPHSPELMLMMQTGIVYDPQAECPQWHAFLERVLPRPEVRAYLQRIVGYTLTGKMTEAAIFFHWGAGSNGKSVFLQVMDHIFGDYGQVVPRSTLIAKQGDNSGASGDIARMAGKRMLQTSETAAGRRLDEETVKALTGGEKQVARHLFQSEFEFKPTGKPHYVTNHLPRITNADSIWRRLHGIFWEVTIPESEQDLDLFDKLATEAPGILAWAIEGCLAWQRQRLAPPPIVREWLSEYRHDQDDFGDFLNTALMPAPDHFEPVKTLFDAYRQWAFDCGVRNPLSMKDFSLALKERNYKPKATARARGFIGLIPVKAGASDPTILEQALSDNL